MLTYTGSKNRFMKLAGNQETGAQNFFDDFYNEHLRGIYAKRPWKFLKNEATVLSVASQQYYKLPNNFKKLSSIYILNGTDKTVPEPIRNQEEWDRMNSSTGNSSDYPDYYFIDYSSVYKICFYPKFSTADLPIVVSYEKNTKDLSVADYTAGTIAIVINTTVVTGTATTFTTAMVGRFIKINDDWYRIATFTSTTVIGLENTYIGATATGLAYTIGEVSELPQDFQIIPIYLTVADWYRKEKEYNSADRFEQKAEIKIKELEYMFSSMVDNVVLDNSGNNIFKNPNLYVTK